MRVDPKSVRTQAQEVKLSVSFYAFGIHARKSCSKNVDEIDTCNQFHQHLTSSIFVKIILIAKNISNTQYDVG